MRSKIFNFNLVIFNRKINSQLKLSYTYIRHILKVYRLTEVKYNNI